MTVGSHPSPTAPKADIKTFPSPPHYWKNRRLYRGACFRKFPKLSGTKVQNVKTGVLGFLTMGNGVNTRTNNMRVHTAGSDTRTTLVGTTARSGWLEWHSHGCPKVTGTTGSNWLRFFIVKQDMAYKNQFMWKLKWCVQFTNWHVKCELSHLLQVIYCG